MKGFVPISIAIIFSAWTTDRVFAGDAVVEPHTDAAVLAADDDWLAAELRGDPKALDARSNADIPRGLTSGKDSLQARFACECGETPQRGHNCAPASGGRLPGATSDRRRERCGTDLRTRFRARSHRGERAIARSQP
jgi:hypothetical protein